MEEKLLILMAAIIGCERVSVFANQPALDNTHTGTPKYIYLSSTLQEHPEQD